MNEPPISPGSRGHDWQAFEALLEHLDPDRDRAAVRYQQIHSKLTRLYEWRACSSPEELADETLDRVASKLASGLEIRSTENYVSRVASMVFREIVRREQRQRSSAEAMARESPQVGPQAGDGDDGDDDLRRCFHRCLGSLESSDREQLLRYYAQEKSAKIDNRRRMAEVLGLAAGTLRIRMHRLRKRLETCIARCLGAQAT